MTYTIKPLEWQCFEWDCVAIVFEKRYYLHKNSKKLWDSPFGDNLTLDKAKAACQLHYENELRKLLIEVVE